MPPYISVDFVNIYCIQTIGSFPSWNLTEVFLSGTMCAILVLSKESAEIETKRISLCCKILKYCRIVTHENGR